MITSTFSALLLFAVSGIIPPWQEDLDAVFDHWFEDNLPGVMLHIVEDGEVTYSQGYGMADIERSIQHSPAMLFNLASVSKQFTAAAIALLALDEQLDLDADVRSILPYVPDYGHPISIRHLVHHTSGLPDILGIMESQNLQFDNGWGNRDVLPLLQDIEQLKFVPGEEFDYSNTNYILLAEIVGAVSGTTLRAFVDHRIFKPLGMTTARVDDDLHRIDDENMVQSYKRVRGGYEKLVRDDFLVGDGNVVASVSEFAIWSENFSSGKVGGDAFIRLMTTPGKLNNGESTSYAFGIFVDEHAGKRCYIHGGSWLGYRCLWIYYPLQKTTLLIFCNHSRANLNQDEVAKIYFESRSE